MDAKPLLWGMSAAQSKVLFLAYEMSKRALFCKFNMQSYLPHLNGYNSCLSYVIVRYPAPETAQFFIILCNQSTAFVNDRKHSC